MIVAAFFMDNNVGDDNEAIVAVMVALIGLMLFLWLGGLFARFIHRRIQKTRLGQIRTK